MTTRPLRRAFAVALLAALPLAGCADEDNDGGTTDEEIQDVRDGAGKAEDRVQEEVDSQQEGSNQDGE